MNVTGTNAASGAAAPSQKGAAAQLSKNFNNFLLLLTQQLKMQDPLQPMDTEKFTQQLVQFASVEQQIASNTKLDNLVSLEKGRASAAALSYIGKAVEINGSSLPLSGSTAEFSYTLQGNAKTLEIKVIDSKGNTVRTLGGPMESGKHRINWDGRDNQGRSLPDGSYRLQVAAADMEGKQIDVSTTVYGVVSDIDLTGDDPIVKIGKSNAKLSDILAVRPTSTETADRFGTAIGYLGRTVEAYSNVVDWYTPPDGTAPGTVTIIAESHPDSISTKVQILDSEGRVVRTLRADPGRDIIAWDGKDGTGQAVTDGQYRLHITAHNMDLEELSAATKIYGKVTSIDGTGSEPLLNVNGVHVRPQDVTNVG